MDLGWMMVLVPRSLARSLAWLGAAGGDNLLKGGDRPNGRRTDGLDLKGHT